MVIHSFDHIHFYGTSNTILGRAESPNIIGSTHHIILLFREIILLNICYIQILTSILYDQPFQKLHNTLVKILQPDKKYSPASTSQTPEQFLLATNILLNFLYTELHENCFKCSMLITAV